MSVTDGMVGHISIMRNAPVNLSQAQTIETQAYGTKDPALKQQLLYKAALEKKYAEQMARGQQEVQDASSVTTGLKKADIIYGSPWQTAAAWRRQDIQRKAAEQYNAGLPINATNRKDLLTYSNGA